jgi:uncharacterized repeat protein (TIGR01451 family)
MRIVFVLAALVLASSSVLAASYSVTSQGGTIALPDGDVSVAINLGGRANLDTVAQVYTNAKNNNVTGDALADLKEATKDELEVAKADDTAFISTPERNILLRYSTCDEANGYRFCFTKITYPEEDGPPLGDRTYSSVKVVNGTFVLPVTITAEKPEGKITVKRSLSSKSVYVGEPVTVTATVTNTGDIPVTGVKLTDFSPLPITKGDVTANIASLNPDEVLTMEYVVEPQSPGTYTFTGAVTPDFVTLSDATLTVLSALNLTITLADGVADAPLPFTVVARNTFDEDIKITSLRITSTSRLAATTGSYAKQERTLLDAKGVTLAPKENVTLTGTLTEEAHGTATLTVIMSYTANGNRIARAEAHAAVREQGLALEAEASIQEVALTITNEAVERITDIRVDWSDGTEDTIGFINAGQSLVLTHAYASEAVTPLDVRASYTLRQRSDARTVRLDVPGLAAQAPSAPSTDGVVGVDVNVGEAPADAAAPTQKPDEAKSPASAPVEKESFIKRLLGWFNGLFE